MKKDVLERILLVRSQKAPSGYRHSNIGIVPNEWLSVRLGDVFCEYNEKVSNSEKYPLYSLTIEQGVVPKTTRYDRSFLITKEQEVYRVVRENDFVYNPMNLRFGALGRHKEKFPVCVSGYYDVFFVTENTGCAYFESLLKSYPLLCYYNRMAIGSLIEKQRVHFSMFCDFYLPIAPLPERNNIAEIMETCDRVIELKKELLEEKKKRKQWLLQNLLDPNSGVRLPGFKGVWKKMSLGNLGCFSKGKGISNRDCLEGTVPCVKYGDIYMFFGEFFQNVNSFTTQEIASKATQIQYGDLLFTGSGEDRMEIGKCTAYLGQIPIAAGGDIIIMTPYQERVDSLYLSYFQNTTGLIEQKANLAQGNSIVHIYTDKIKQLKVWLPPTLSEQTAIAEILSTADKEIALLTEEIQAWELKKKALMQLLLTGIVRTI